MAGNGPMIAALTAWLREEPGHAWEGTATEAREAAAWHRTPESQWWPPNGKAFMDAITAHLELLREVGVTVEERRSKGRRVKRFALEGGPPPGDDGGDLLRPCPGGAFAQGRAVSGRTGSQGSRRAGAPLSSRSRG